MLLILIISQIPIIGYSEKIVDYLNKKIGSDWDSAVTPEIFEAEHPGWLSSACSLIMTTKKNNLTYMLVNAHGGGKNKVYAWVLLFDGKKIYDWSVADTKGKILSAVLNLIQTNKTCQDAWFYDARGNKKIGDSILFYKNGSSNASLFKMAGYHVYIKDFKKMKNAVTKYFKPAFK